MFDVLSQNKLENHFDTPCNQQHYVLLFETPPMRSDITSFKYVHCNMHSALLPYLMRNCNVAHPATFDQYRIYLPHRDIFYAAPGTGTHYPENSCHPDTSVAERLIEPII